MNVGLLTAKLMAYAIDGVEPDFEKDIEIDYAALYEFSKIHSVSNLVCYALAKLSMLPAEHAPMFKKELRIGMAKEATQEIETGEIAAELEKHNIKYMLLKGSVMKLLYPRPDLRSMCDVDIQYDTSRKDELDDIMLPLGYTRAETSGTDGINISYIKKPFMYIEFHGALMDKNIPRYNSYFGTDFERTVPLEGCRVEYRDEDFFVFMAAHLAKHYFLEGTGLRSLADVWLFLRKKPQLDKDYVFSQLRQLKLDEFMQIIIGVNRVLFENEQPDTLQKNVICYILGSGTYGVTGNSSADVLGRESKFSYMLRRLFPNREFMAIHFPIVKKCAFLLPLFWLVRLVRTGIKKGYRNSDVDLVMRADQGQLDARSIPGNPGKG